MVRRPIKLLAKKQNNFISYFNFGQRSTHSMRVTSNFESSFCGKEAEEEARKHEMETQAAKFNTFTVAILTTTTVN